MKISVVVPAFNEEKLLGRSLDAIQQATAAFAKLGWESEIVVCDNNSTDRTASVAQAYGARVVFEPVNQISRARNRGAEAATGDWLIFVDADSFPSDELFARVAQQIQSGRALGGGCLLRMDEYFPVLNLFLAFWNSVSQLMKWAAGSFIFCRADAFRAVGGFSQKLYASEEIDFCQRLKGYARRLGLRLVIINEVRMITSARKFHLYKTREHLFFFLKAALLPRLMLRSPKHCLLWYDGRR